jgi:cytochrome c556
MRSVTRVWAAAVAGLALAVGLCWNGSGQAGDEKAIKAAVNKIADALQKGNADVAKSEAAALAKKVEDVHDVMEMLGKRSKDGTKGGIGVGEVPGAILPDDINLTLQRLGQGAPAQVILNKEGAAYERMAYVTAAVAEFALAKVPDKKDEKPGMTIKTWTTSAKAAREAALELAKAAASKSPDAVKTAASRVVANCNNCHSEWRNN